MKPEIDYEPDGDKGYFRMTLNGVKSGPPLSFTELCSAKFWLENSWPEIVTTVLACSHAQAKPSTVKKKPAKKRKAKV